MGSFGEELQGPAGSSDDSAGVRKSREGQVEMYSRNPQEDREASPRGAFGDGFLGAMNEEIEDEVEDFGDDEGALPTIDVEVLDSGAHIRAVALKEASLDEPLPGLDRVLIPREEEWDYANADFHSQTETVEETTARAAASEAASEVVSVPSSDPTVFVPEAEDDLLSTLGVLTGAEPQVVEEEESIDPESAFDEIEDQGNDYEDDDIESILAGIGGGSDAEEEGESKSSDEPETNFRLSEEDIELMQGFEIDEIISLAIDMKASDIHVPPGKRIRFRINGSMVPILKFEPIPGEVTRRIQQKIVTNVADAIFLEHWELDTSYTVRSGKYRGRRVRVSVTKGFEEVVLVMRIISDEIPLPHELEIEDELLAWSELPNGLVLMNGPTGTGKSTTLASIVQNIQMNLDGVIVTVEKPVEYVYKDHGNAVVYQREVGRDTLSFSAALDSAMRMDPDVILIGEMRNAMEANAVIYAADTGHLSLSTTHANSAASTVSRIKKMFEGDERRQIMESLATVSRGFASQVLCKTADGKGRFAVREILTVNNDIADLIVQGDDRAIRRVQEERGITLDHALVRAVRSGRCTREEARRKSSAPAYFDALLAEEPKIL